MTASDRVDIRGEGSLTGDVVAQRISIEDGAYFKGGIDIRKPGQKANGESKETRHGVHHPDGGRGSGGPGVIGFRDRGSWPIGLGSARKWRKSHLFLDFAPLWSESLTLRAAASPAARNLPR